MIAFWQASLTLSLASKRLFKSCLRAFNRWLDRDGSAKTPTNVNLVMKAASRLPKVSLSNSATWNQNMNHFQFIFLSSYNFLWKLHFFVKMPVRQKFRESNVFTKEIAKELIWRNIFLARLNFSLFLTVLYTVWKSTVKCDHVKKISWNQLFSNFFSNTLIWRKNVIFFFPVKIVIAFYCTFSHCNW